MSFIKTLYGLDKKGGFKIWEVVVRNVNGMVDFNIYHGKEGGKIQAKESCIMKAHQGRTLYEQGVMEAEAKIKKQMDKGYRENKDDLVELPLLAMLAADYRKQGHRINYTCYTSDKYDGVRCLAKHKGSAGIVLESRTGQPYDVPHITEALKEIMLEGDVLDGEIYLHGYALQEITSAVKRTDTQGEIDKAQRKYDRVANEGIQTEEWEKIFGEASANLQEALLIHEIRPKLKFYVFDVPSDKIFDERLADLQYWTRPSNDDVIVFTEYDVAVSEEDMKEKHKDAVARGFEGIMLRNREGLYESGKRSADLQKYKEFLDTEFLVVDTELDKDGLIVYVCKNDVNDNLFRVIFGSKEQKLAAVAVRDTFPGKYLTVKFQSRYKDTLLPQFPTGVIFRDCDAAGNVLE